MFQETFVSEDTHKNRLYGSNEFGKHACFHCRTANVCVHSWACPCRKSLSPQDCSPLRVPSWLGHRLGHGSLRVPGESAGCTQVRGSGPPEPPTRTSPQNSHNAQASHGLARPPHRGFVCRREAQVDADRDRSCPRRLQLRLCGGSPQLRARCGVRRPRPCSQAQMRV